MSFSLLQQPTASNNQPKNGRSSALHRTPSANPLTMEPVAMATPLRVDSIEPPDLTNTLNQSSKRLAGGGSFGTVYRCLCALNGEVAVKAISFPRSIDQTEKNEFLRKMKRELGIWKRLDHRNVVPLLGTAQGEDFGSDHPCMVSMWMPHGTLAEYVSGHGNVLSIPGRVQLITGSAAGLEYLHSKSIVHGDFHPGNIMIDTDHNPRLTDFGFSQTLDHQNDLTYLRTNSTRPGALMWVAPELLHPHLFPDGMVEPKLNCDIYSLGSIMLFILSGKFPQSNSERAKDSEELQNPLRPPWPVIPDVVWHFIERCWSPRVPRNRPSAQEVLSFSRDRLQQILQPNPTSDINVVLFGALGCGKSSIVNLLAKELIAPVSTNMEPCTKQPRCYKISIGERRFRIWDTMGFRLPRGGDISPLSPYEQAHGILRNIPDGVDLILLCARKDEISSSHGGLYWLINDFFFGGRAPVAFVVTHFDTPDERWWERNRRFIINRTGIPIQSIPIACTTTVQTGCDQSRQTLTALLESCARTITPIPPRLDLSSHEAAAFNIATHCGLSNRDATTLVEKFSRPRRPINVVFFGKAGVGKSSVINLMAGRPVAQVTSGIESCTLDSSSYMFDNPKKQFVIWDTVGFNGVRKGHDNTRQAVMNAAQLVRSLSMESGVDLLVFVKECGKLTPSELNCYRLFEEFLCKGQVPVAVIITHLERHEPMEQWWEMHGEGLLKALSGNVICHACITSLSNTDPEDSPFSKRVSESRLAVEAMLENCVSLPKGEEISAQLPLKRSGETGRVPEKMTVKNLVNHCGLTMELAKELVKSYSVHG